MAASGCVVGPKYVRPVVQAPPAYKELAADAPAGTDAWKPAQPSDAAGRGQWWTIFNEPTLNTLEDQLNTGNQRLPNLRAIVDERSRERNLRRVRAGVRCVVGSGSLGAAQ